MTSDQELTLSTKPCHVGLFNFKYEVIKHSSIYKTSFLGIDSPRYHTTNDIKLMPFFYRQKHFIDMTGTFNKMDVDIFKIINYYLCWFYKKISL